MNTKQKESIKAAIVNISYVRDALRTQHENYVDEYTAWEDEPDENLAGDEPEDPDVERTIDFLEDAMRNLEDALERHQ